jgi:hypothetical protein
MRFYSAQSVNASTTDSAIAINSADTYGDKLILDPTKGQQVQVVVEVKVPTGTTGGAFSTSYGVQTTGTTASGIPDLALRLSSNSLATSTMASGDSLPIGVFGIKTRDNTVGWITDLSFKINSKEGYSPRLILGDSRIYLGDSVLAASSGAVWLDDNTVTFHLSSARLSKDWGDFCLYINPLPTTTPMIFSVTLDAGEIKAEDNSGKSLNVSSLEDIISNEITFSPRPPETVGSILASLSPSSPMSGNIAISADETTESVVLGVFRLKSSNQDSILKSLRLKIDNDFSVDPSVLFSNFYLSDGVNNFYYSPSERNSEGLVDFYYLNIPLPRDTYKDLTFKVDVKSGLSPFSASTTLLANSIDAMDANDNAVSTASSTDVTSSNLTFTLWPLALSSVSSGDNSYSFNLTNNSDDNLFISKTSPSGNLISTESSQDTDIAFLVPAGSTRNFSLYSVDPRTSITINYGASSSTPTALSLTQELTY